MKAPHQNPSPATPARFISLSRLLAPGGLIAVTFDPPISRRTLLKQLRNAGVRQWKVNGAYSCGRGEVYYEREAVRAWIAGNTSMEARK